MKQIHDLISEVRESFKITPEVPPKERTEPITLWVPESYKHMWDELQARSNRKFGRAAQDVLKKLIDEVIKAS